MSVHVYMLKQHEEPFFVGQLDHAMLQNQHIKESDPNEDLAAETSPTPWRRAVPLMELPWHHLPLLGPASIS